MDNAGTPEKMPKVSAPSTDDIPVAMRETPDLPTKRTVNKPVLIASLVGLGVVALIAGGLLSLRLQQVSDPSLSQNSSSTAAQPSPRASATASPKPEDAILGHFAYPEAAQSELEPIVADGSIKMRKAAARAYQSMVAAARQEGVSLVAISGFRSIADQQYLYFNVKAERGETAAERAQVSAPPGYSEHHTGYAVDIGDGNVPATNLRQEFDGTSAYRWLKDNAARFSFEISFPKNNPQGVSYEPWHWRYVGDIQSLKTFYKAREQKP